MMANAVDGRFTPTTWIPDADAITFARSMRKCNWLMRVCAWRPCVHIVHAKCITYPRQRQRPMRCPASVACSSCIFIRFVGNKRDQRIGRRIDYIHIIRYIPEMMYVEMLTQLNRISGTYLQMEEVIHSGGTTDKFVEIKVFASARAHVHSLAYFKLNTISTIHMHTECTTFAIALTLTGEHLLPLIVHQTLSFTLHIVCVCGSLRAVAAAATRRCCCCCCSVAHST